MADMRFDYTQKMQQQLKLSPQMIQSIELLRLPVEELCDKIYQEAEKNPAIEIVKDADLSVLSVSTKGASRFDSDSDNFQAFLENTAGPQETLQEHLLFQLSLLEITENERYIGEKIIQSLDENGFNSVPPVTLLEENENTQVLQKMLDIIHDLEPQGTAFNSIQESLAFQASKSSDSSHLVQEILQNHFLLLEKKRPNLIARHLNENGLTCSSEQVEQALAFIKTLDPYPAHQFSVSNTQIQYVIPEIRVRKQNEAGNQDQEDESLIIEFLRGTIPEIIISNVYTELISQNAEKTEHQFAVESVHSAKQFMNALAFRTKSIYDAVKIIVTKQKDFFYKGPGHLIPLRQKDIAQEIGVHETTISRIANGKYLQCDWGIFELKYFFTNSVLQNSHDIDIQGGDSKESIKHRLLLLLKDHEKSSGKKLSDSKLTQMLNDEGIDIARRTVAKYRSELNIESSFDRL